jgi:SAM-dependent methyltransferase
VCGRTAIAFVRENLAREDVAGRTVLEVGALDVNGSVRPDVEALGPASYLGVDIVPGPKVDEICDVNDLVARYGPEAFDIVISTELLEHVRAWRSAVTNLKGVLRPGGVLVITTRSRGFKIHGYPWDYWRYEPEDMRLIFADFDEVTIEADTEAPGVFVKARRPNIHREPVLLDAIALHSIARNQRIARFDRLDEVMLRIRFARRRYLLRESLK